MYDNNILSGYHRRLESLKWIEVFYLLLKYDDENGTRRVADLELNGEWATKAGCP